MATIKKSKNVPLSDWIDAFDGVTNEQDHIFGYGGNDTIFAGGGNDLIWGGEGGDAMYGGAGTDTCATAKRPRGSPSA
jgi:Ca2+-binding RTX toxin-like protein